MLLLNKEKALLLSSFAVSLVPSMGEQKRCKPEWMPTPPVSGGSMEASAHQELMDSPREVQLKFHTGFFC